MLFIAIKSDLVAAIFKQIILVTIPVVFAYILVKDSGLFTSIWIAGVSILVCLVILWKCGLNQSDRYGLYSTIEKAVLKRS